MSKKLLGYLNDRERQRLSEAQKKEEKTTVKVFEQGWVPKSETQEKRGSNIQTIENKSIRLAAQELIAAYEKIKAPNISSPEQEEYYFENFEEFVVYCAQINKSKNCKWLHGEKYMIEVQKGYQLYEEDRYKEAIEVLKNSLRLNPIGISARFEMCEAYLKLGKFHEAKNTLMEMKDYFVFDKHVAKFYRRMGFIATEEKKYQCAAACLRYSQKYENNPKVGNELEYIRRVSGINPFNNISIEEELVRCGVPIIR